MIAAGQIRAPAILLIPGQQPIGTGCKMDGLPAHTGRERLGKISETENNTNRMADNGKPVKRETSYTQQPNRRFP